MTSALPAAADPDLAPPDTSSGDFWESLREQPLDEQITSIQPGGGNIVRLELAWGHVRRWWLRTFRKGYVAKMAALRQGPAEQSPAPFPVLDPRDRKYYRNQPGYFWKPEDDPFGWRDRLPFARAGLAELLCYSVMFFGSAAVLAAWVAAGTMPLWANVLVSLIALTLTVLGGLIVWFFRDPVRPTPLDPGLVVSPADGTVAEIIEIADHPELGGPAVRIGVFLSIFNVHLNRAPQPSRVVGLRYSPGKFLNALRPESARENERLTIYLETTHGLRPRRMIVRQITGAIARRIVCWLSPGDHLAVGERVGMIKLGSRTELLIPSEEGLEITTKVGDKLKAGLTVLAKYPVEMAGTDAAANGGSAP